MVKTVGSIVYRISGCLFSDYVSGLFVLFVFFFRGGDQYSHTACGHGEASLSLCICIEVEIEILFSSCKP